MRRSFTFDQITRHGSLAAVLLTLWAQESVWAAYQVQARAHDLITARVSAAVPVADLYTAVSDHMYALRSNQEVPL
jgi:hypothetical protein